MGHVSSSIDYARLATLVRDKGSLVMMDGELPAPVDEFRRELRRAGRTTGIRILTSHRQGSFVAWDPEYVVPAEILRAAVDTLDSLPSTQPTCPVDQTIMRDQPGGWICGWCGHQIEAPALDRPIPEFTGPTFEGS